MTNPTSTRSTTALPPVVPRAEWLAARTALLTKEKEATRLRDAISAERRRLPMVRIEKDYAFTGPDGPASLLDMFDGRHQLYMHHFMWIDEGDKGCPACTAAADANFTPPILGARGLDQLATPYNFLDLTPYGRQEDWEDSPAGWPQKPTYG